MGKYSDNERNDRDYYPTPIKGVQPLFKHLKPNSSFIEPCWGDGRLVDHIEENTDATCVYGSDVDPQFKLNSRNEPITPTNYSVGTHSALDPILSEIADRTQADYFITNPPWLNSKASGYLLNTLINSLSSIRPTWLLLKGAYLFNQRSAQSISVCKEIVPIGRLKWIENSEHSGKEDCAWFLFDQTTPQVTVGPTVHPRYK